MKSLKTPLVILAYIIVSSILVFMADGTTENTQAAIGISVMLGWMGLAAYGILRYLG